jgi:RNA polymerase sigma factor (sigma-70 family)
MISTHTELAVASMSHLLHSAAPDNNDVALAQRITARDQSALECFYRTSIGRIYGLALRITRNSSTAEEVVQDVYVQLWNRAAGFDPMRGSLLAWTLTICRSRALDALRRRDTAILDPDPTARLDASVGSAGNPQDLLHASRQNTELHSAMQRLSAQQRQLLSLAFFRDLTHAELAVHTGLPLGTVKSTMRRTLAMLREDLDRE